MTTTTSGAHPVRTPRPRIDYLDAARALAIIGMLLAHIAAFVPLPDFVLNLVSGRSAIVFAVLAGVSTTLIARSGAVTEHERLGYTNAYSSRNLLVRGIILFVLGITLPLISVGPIIILATYSVLYLLAIPVLRLRTRYVAGLAAVTAFVAPVLSFWIRSTWPNTGDEIVIGGVPSIASFTSLEGTGQAIRQLLVDGMYPVLTWIPFLLAGIVIGRLIVSGTFTARLSATAGLILAIVGYGTSWVLTNVTDVMSGRIAPYREFDPALAHASDEKLLDIYGAIVYADFGVTNINDPKSLLLASHHSGSITEIIGGIGFALLLLAGLSLLERVAAPVLVPVNNLGRMALTYYVAHIVGFLAVVLIGSGEYSLWILLVGFIVIPMVFAAVWFRFFRRGPLEAVMYSAARRASGPRPARQEDKVPAKA